MKYPESLFVYCNENDDYSWDCNEQETWTGEIEYILQSEYDKLKTENERLRFLLDIIVDKSSEEKIIKLAQQALNEVMK